MKTGHSSRPALPVLIAWMCVVLASCPGLAQQAHPPTLDEILERLQRNLVHYRSEIPTFFCDEHLVSKSNQYFGQQVHRITEIDSVFRLKRVSEADQTTSLTESREVKKIDGRPASGGVVSGPTMLVGAFSGALSVVSRSGQACMNYRLRPIQTGAVPHYYVVDFSSVPGPDRPVDCLLEEDASGRALIDPASMQIARIEIKTPRHTIFPTTARGEAMPALLGTWDITVDYKPALLGGKSFWMPATISSGTMTKFVDWSFKASYGNFHKLEVTSRIVPAGELSRP